MVFVQVWPQLSFPDAHEMEDFPSILLEYGLGRHRHQIAMGGFLRPRLTVLSPSSVGAGASGRREGIGGVWERALLDGQNTLKSNEVV